MMIRGPLIPLACSILVIGGLLALLLIDSSSPSSGGELFLYCAAGMKQPVAAVVAAYEQEYGTSVQVQYAGSGTLLNNLRITRTGDLYLAADRSYMTLARAAELVDEELPLADMRPVISLMHQVLGSPS